MREEEREGGRKGGAQTVCKRGPSNFIWRVMAEVRGHLGEEGESEREEAEGSREGSSRRPAGNAK